MVRVLLSHPVIEIDHKDLSGVTALWAACQNNNSEVVELLLDPPVGVAADVNLPKLDGCTPLWVAASRGHLKCMELLIKYGADLNETTKYIVAPVRKSRKSRNQSQDTVGTPLFVASQNGMKPAVDLLLAANADVNRPRSVDGITSLMMATHNGHSDIVDVLLKSGADPIQASTTGLNALACAAMNGHLDILKTLYDAVTKVLDSQALTDFMNDGESTGGWTPLHLACMGGHEDTVKYLVEEIKVDVHKKDLENKNALEHARQNKHQSIVSSLTEYYE